MFSILGKANIVPFVAKRMCSTISSTGLKIPAEVAPIFSLENANRKQILKNNTRIANEKFRTHKTDTGSPQVQIAIMTEKIKSLAIHFATHKKDKKGFRGYMGIVNNRKRMMRYLRKYNPEQYIFTVKELKLEREAELLKSGKGDKHGQKYFKNI